MSQNRGRLCLVVLFVSSFLKGVHVFVELAHRRGTAFLPRGENRQHQVLEDMASSVKITAACNPFVFHIHGEFCVLLAACNQE